MRNEAAGRGRESVRGKRAESGHSSAEPRGTEPRGTEPRGTEPRGTERRSKTSSEEVSRLKEFLLTMQSLEKQTGAVMKGGSGGDAGVRRKLKEEDDVHQELRRRLNRLEKEKLELTSSHNQEVCVLEAELARLRAAVERGEAERAELQYELSVTRRETEKEKQKNADLQMEKQTLTERQVELQQTVSDLHRALDLTRSSRDQDLQGLQQDLDERERLRQREQEENHRLHGIVMDQEQALAHAEQRITAQQRDAEKEAELNRRQNEELKYLREREERHRLDKQCSEQRIKCLESNIEAERAAHLESKFNSEIVQLRLRDLEAALAVERSSLQEATCSVEQLKTHLTETEKKRETAQRRSDETRAQLHRLQQEFDKCKSDFSTALETGKKATSDLTKQIEGERKRHESATSQLQQQVTEQQNKTHEAFIKFVKDVKETILQHFDSAGDCGSWSPDDTLKQMRAMLSAQRQRQEEANKQIEELLVASEQLLDENQSLKDLSSLQKSHLQESEQLVLRLKQEVTRLQTEFCDWSNLSRQLQVELQRERDERKLDRAKMEDDRAKMEDDRAKMEDDVRRLKELQQEETEARVTSLHFLLQRIQPQCIMEDLSWDELWLRVRERVEQINSDHDRVKHQVSSLQSVLSRLEDKVKKREQDWTKKHQQAVTRLHHHLQASRSECRALQSQVTSLTSDLSSVCNESGRFQWACLLLGGALSHTQMCVRRLAEQKALLCLRLSKSDAVEQEVRSLAAALEANDDRAEDEKKKKALRRWRSVVTAVTALKRWCMMGKRSPVLFRLQMGSGTAVGVTVCGDARKERQTDKEAENQETCLSQWLRSKRLSSVVLSSMSELQGALSGQGSSPQSVMSAAQSGLSRLLPHLLSQSDAAPSLHKQNTLMRPMTAEPHMKGLVSRLQQHFLDFSQRLHSTEVERRSLRLELNKVRRAAKKRDEEDANMVPCDRFDAVCSELREALSREQEAQGLVQDLNSELNQVQTRLNSVNQERTEAQGTIAQTTQFLSEARREVCRKERSLRILGKHLSVVQKERRQLEDRLREAQEELQHTAKRKEQLITFMTMAENNCTQLRESLIQSHRSLSSKPRPLTLPESLTEAESIMGDPGVVACQSLVSSMSLLSQTFCSRIGWLEQEVSAHQSHVTALRSELQDACLRQNQAFIHVTEIPDFLPFIGTESVPLCDSPRNVPVISSPTSCSFNPAPFQSLHAELAKTKSKEMIT